jgi:hypothetical protein
VPMFRSRLCAGVNGCRRDCLQMIYTCDQEAEGQERHGWNCGEVVPVEMPQP